jgi:nucleoside 2-deoxyribosyltransferase
LSNIGLRVFNPCKIIIPDLPRERMPAYIARECYRLIDIADGIILFVDYYGRDCAAEIGYSIARNKNVFPYSKEGVNSLYLEQDWMIRPMLRPLSRSIEELIKNLVLVYENVEEKNG